MGKRYSMPRPDDIMRKGGGHKVETKYSRTDDRVGYLYVCYDCAELIEECTCGDLNGVNSTEPVRD